MEQYEIIQTKIIREETPSLQSAQVALPRNKEAKIHKETDAPIRHIRLKGPCLKEKKSTYDIEEVGAIFASLQEFLEKEEFDKELQMELDQAYPDYKDTLKNRCIDLKRKDHGIVVAGEGSSGKSTLINNIIGESILKCRNVESTAAICRIRNSETREIQVCFNKQSAMKSFTFPHYQQKEEKEDFKKTIQKYTDKETISKENIDLISAVDILVPLPLLKNNTLIVDTPGIGGSKALGEKLMRYIPNAVAFVFVVNAANAGGMHDDRLPVIVKSICQQYKEGKMPCFDPKDVIFVTNKWDSVRKEEDSDDEIDLTWKKIQEKIRGIWENVNEENVFRTSFQTKLEENRTQTEFKRFEKKLSEIVEKNCTSRIERHIMFLEEFTKQAGRGIKTRLFLLERNEAENMIIMEYYKERIMGIREEITETKKLLEKEIPKILENLSHDLCSYIQSEAGKNTILNPPYKKPILDVSFVRLEDKVPERINSFIKQWCSGAEIQKAFQVFEDNIKKNCEDIQNAISAIESEMTDTQSLYNENLEDLNSSNVPFYVGVLASSPLWIPLLVAAGTLCLVAGFIISPLIITKIKKLSSKDSKSKVVDEEYKKCIQLFSQSAIKDQLDKTYGDHYRKLISRILEDTLAKRVSSILLTIKQLIGRQKDIREKQTVYYNLNEQLTSIRDNLYQLK